MLFIVIALLLGFILGTIRWIPRKIINIRGILINGGILLLVFGMGLSIGTNSQVLENLRTIGVRALILSFLSALGGMLGAFLMEKLLRKSMKEKDKP